MNFTDTKIKNLKPQAERYEVWEGKGFGMRVTPKGVKSWVAVYHYNGRPKRITYGSYPLMGLEEAHSAHAKAMLELKAGIDPAQEKKLIKTANLDALTMSQLITEYIEKWAKPHKTTWKADQSLLQGRVEKKWGPAKAKQIKRRDIVLFLDEISKTAPIMANRTLAVLRRMFNFAIERDILEASPCSQVKMPSPENQRDRMLNDDEIKIFWYGLDKTRMDTPTKLALKLMLVTAQRKGEVVAMRWDEIDEKKRIWEIPREKSKNKKPHRVYLSGLAQELLSECKKIRDNLNSPWVFPSLDLPDSYIQEMTINQAMRRQFIETEKKKKNNMNTKARKKPEEKVSAFNGAAKFTPHDLRRTAASHMTELKIPRLVVSKVLNHTDSSVTAIYDRHTYEKEKQEAWEIWAAHLTQLIQGQL